jgi:hypothetical protein
MHSQWIYVHKGIATFSLQKWINVHNSIAMLSLKKLTISYTLAIFEPRLSVREEGAMSTAPRSQGQYQSMLFPVPKCQDKYDKYG